MRFNKTRLALAAGTIILASCGSGNNDKSTASNDSASVSETKTGDLVLPAPDTTAGKTKFSNVIGWPDGKTPVAPAGFSVSKFADEFSNPRWIYQAPNGDIFIAEAATEMSLAKKAAAIASGKAKSGTTKDSENQITILRDANNDGKPELRQAFLSGLNQPVGMLILGNSFYVANTDGIWKFPYSAGQTKITARGQKILALPAGGYNNHWTRNIVSNADGSKIYVSVGSGSNVAEHGMANETRRANILEINPDGSGERVYASGLRNPVGMDWAPGTSTLWTSVNERDMLGDDLVPDYITSVKDGAFYGWPYSYYGQNEDPRLKGRAPEMVKKAIAPDVPVGSHTASLGLAFYDQKAFPQKYQGGAFVGQHGSWNRSSLVGYKVLFVPFKNGKPAGKPEDFLTGFIADQEKGEVYGRPVGVAVLQNGSMLVADDASNTIWRVTAK